MVKVYFYFSTDFLILIYTKQLRLMLFYDHVDISRNTHIFCACLCTIPNVGPSHARFYLLETQNRTHRSVLPMFMILPNII